MPNLHTRYPYYGEACTSFVAYFQNLQNWLAGYRIVSGFAVTRASSSAVTIASGTYMKGDPSTTVYAGATLSGVTAAASTYHRYDLIYLDTADGTVKRAVGTPVVPTTAGDFLENLVPQPPDIAAETDILLAVICVDDAGIRSTDNGGTAIPYSVAGCADMRMKSNIGAHLISYLYTGSEARGDLIMRGASNWGRFAPGTSGKYLKSAGAAADLIWDDVLISSLYHASQATGDLVLKKAAGWNLLPAAAANKYLMSNGVGAEPTYELVNIGSLNVASEAKGDIITRGTTNWDRKATGTIGQILTSGGSGADLSWSTRSFDVAFPFGDGSAVLASGACEFRIPVTSKIVSARIRECGLISSSITCTLYQHSLTGARGSTVDTFVMSSATTYEETGLSIAVTAGDWLTIVTSGITTAKQITVSLSLEVTG